MIFLTEISLYNVKPDEISQEQIEALSRVFPEHKDNLLKWKTGEEKWFNQTKPMHIDDLQALGLPEKVVSLKPIQRLTLPEPIMAALREGKKELKSLEGAVQIHLPGNDLPAMRQVINFDNSCTEDIDDWLKKGWQILAILPQPNHRRPDYILGHSVRKDREH